MGKKLSRAEVEIIEIMEVAGYNSVETAALLTELTGRKWHDGTVRTRRRIIRESQVRLGGYPRIGNL